MNHRLILFFCVYYLTNTWLNVDGKEDLNGVSLFDDETILSNLDLICGRIKQLLEVIGTLRQFSKLCTYLHDGLLNKHSFFKADLCFLMILLCNVWKTDYKFVRSVSLYYLLKLWNLSNVDQASNLAHIVMLALNLFLFFSFGQFRITSAEVGRYSNRSKLKRIRTRWKWCWQ